jgi:hypothetical protein
MAAGHDHHAMLASVAQAGPGLTAQWWVPVGLHTLGYLLVTAVLALVVYYKVGVEVLRRAWFNLDLIWAGALIAMGILTLVI